MPFGDVIWVKEARQVHDAFVDSMRDRNIIVHEFGAILADNVVCKWPFDQRGDMVHLGLGAAQEPNKTTGSSRWTPLAGVASSPRQDCPALSS